MKVFISYRRSDTQHLAGRIADRLRALKGIDKVFIDVDGIEPGEDFESEIYNAIAESSVCLLLIGQHWLGREPDQKQPRIFDDRDFIRLEARAALASDRKVLPVLTDEAAMPSKEELPEDLQRLPQINGISVRHLHFDKDVESLFDSVLSRRKEASKPPILERHPLLGRSLRGLAGASIAAIVLIVAAIIHNEATGGRSLEESFGGRTQVWLLVLGILAVGALAPFVVRRLGKRNQDTG